MIAAEKDWRLSANEILVGLLKELKDNTLNSEKVKDTMYEEWKTILYWAKEVVANDLPIFKIGTKANEHFDSITYVINQLGEELKDMDPDKPELYWDKLINIFENRKFSTIFDSYKEVSEEKEDFEDKYLRLYAEFDNFKKRTQKEKSDIRTSTKYNTLSDLLDILDDLTMASKQSEDEGVKLIINKLDSYISKQGISIVDTSGDFDPDKHESISVLDMGEEKKNKIIDCVKRGYELDGKILRYPKVVVGS